FSDGSPLAAATVKASMERSIRLASNDIPAAFEAIEGVAEFRSGAAQEVEGIRARSGLEIELRLHDALPILPSLLTDGRASIVALAGGPARDLAGGAEGAPDRPGPFPPPRPPRGPSRSRAHPALLARARRAPGPDRVPGVAARLGDRQGIPRRPARPRPGPPPAGSRSRAARSPTSRKHRRDTQEEHLLRDVPLQEPGGLEPGIPPGARGRGAQPGVRVGGARTVRDAGDRPHSARRPGPRSGPAAAPPVARESARDDP